MTLTDQEVADIKADMLLVRDQAYEWSGGALDLQLEFTVMPAVFTGFTAPDFVIGPFEIDDELLDEYVSTGTDFVYVVTGVNDYAQDLRLAYWCGSSYGELSIRGAGYAYIQYNHDVCNSVTIDGQTGYVPLIHEWIHNLDWALYNINGIPDWYQHVGPDWGKWDHATWPACGTGSSDPLDWFPSIDFCEWDPDWMDCNNSASAGACLHAGEQIFDMVRTLATTKYKDLSFRIYETYQGARVIVLGREFNLRDGATKKMMDEFNCDPLYTLLCIKQGCYRARLTPKPSRMKLKS